MALVLPGNSSGVQRIKETNFWVEKVSQLAPLPWGCGLLCRPSPPLAVVGLPRGFAAYSLVWTQKNFLVRTLIPFKDIPHIDGSVKFKHFSPISETSILQGGHWCTLGGPMSFPALGAFCCAELQPPAQTAIAVAAPSLPSGTGHVLSCSAQRVWQNSRWELKLLPVAQGIPLLKQNF